MDIIQVIIFIALAVVTIIQQKSKAGKEKTPSSPKDVLADMFPTPPDEETDYDPDEPPVRHDNKTRKAPSPRSYRAKEQPAVRKTVTPPMGESRRENRNANRPPVRLSTREEARRAFISSEIFNRKY